MLSVNSGVVTVLCRPGRGVSQVEKSPRLNWTTQFLTVAYDGACSSNISIGQGFKDTEELNVQNSILRVHERGKTFLSYVKGYDFRRYLTSDNIPFSLQQ